VIWASFFGQLNGRDIGKPAWAKGHVFFQLLFDSLDNHGIVETGIMNTISVHIDILRTSFQLCE